MTHVNITIDARDHREEEVTYHDALRLAIEQSAEVIPDGTRGLRFGKCKEVRIRRSSPQFPSWKFQFDVLEK